MNEDNTTTFDLEEPPEAVISGESEDDLTEGDNE